MPWKLRVFPIVFEFFRGEGQALAAQAVAFLAPLAWFSGDGQKGNVVKETDRKNKELFLAVKIFYFVAQNLRIWTQRTTWTEIRKRQSTFLK